MQKRNAAILSVIASALVLFACSRPVRVNESDSEGIRIFATSLDERSGGVQVVQSQILPPHGIRVTADAASLTLQVSTSIDDPLEALQDIHGAVSEITRLASESERVALDQVSLTQLGTGNINRGTPAPRVDNLDTSSVRLRLTTDLAAHNSSLLDSLTTFNDFLKSVSLPETITIQILSLETALKDSEIYREQLIANVYRELQAIQDEYGESVQFEVTGLHGTPQMIRLTDTEFYIYIEPSIVVKEF
jgi:hypothetical protein